MRIISIVTAVAVCALLFLAVFQRDAMLSLARGEAAVAPDAPPVAAAATPTEAETDRQTRIAVVAMRSVAQEIDGAVVLRGRTEAARAVDVKAEISGLVISTPLRKGAEVAEGDLLCELDPGTSEVALAEARARLEEARASLADAEINATAAARLSQEGFATETRVTSANAVVKSASAAVQSAEASIAAAETEIGRLRILAPFGGLLESDTAELGSLLQPGALCATIIQLDPIKLVGFAPETQVDRIAVGAVAGGRLASGREVQGEVTFISRSADPATRTFRVEVAVDNSDNAIRDGQTAEIMISAEGARAHLLPQSALTLSNDGELGVRLVGPGDIVAFAPVRIIRDTTDGVWVAGLDDEVAVIVVGQEYVNEGVAVTPSYQNAAK